MKNKQTIEKAFDSHTRAYYTQVCVAMLANYIQKCTERSEEICPLPSLSPQDMSKLRDTDFPQELSFQNIPELIKNFIDLSNHTMHPRSMGHQTAVPLPLEVIPSMCMAILNSSMSCYETWPISSVLEKKMITRLSGKIGYDSTQAWGFFTSWGSLGGLTALLAARQQTAWDIRTNGSAQQKLAIMCSSESHYSLRRAAHIMGLWTQGIVLVPSNETWKIEKDVIQKTYTNAVKDGKKIFAFVSSACNTGPWIYEDIQIAADFCEQHGIWLHVDGAHGASAVLSTEYNYLTKGIERADSVVRDMHKLMLTPTLLTAVIFKNEAHSFTAVQHAAPYLYEGMGNKEKTQQGQDHLYDVSQRSLECTKSAMVFKLYFGLMSHGTKVYSNHVTSRFNITRQFATLIKQEPEFELGVEPEANIILFRYIPVTTKTAYELDQLQLQIRKEMLKWGKFYLVKTIFKGKTYLRCSLMNPLTTMEDIQKMLHEIKNIWHNLVSSKKIVHTDHTIPYEIPKKLVSHTVYFSPFLPQK